MGSEQQLVGRQAHGERDIEEALGAAATEQVRLRSHGRAARTGTLGNRPPARRHRTGVGVAHSNSECRVTTSRSPGNDDRAASTSSSSGVGRTSSSSTTTSSTSSSSMRRQIERWERATAISARLKLRPYEKVARTSEYDASCDSVSRCPSTASMIDGFHAELVVHRGDEGASIGGALEADDPERRQAVHGRLRTHGNTTRNSTLPATRPQASREALAPSAPLLRRPHELRRAAGQSAPDLGDLGGTPARHAVGAVPR